MMDKINKELNGPKIVVVGDFNQTGFKIDEAMQMNPTQVTRISNQQINSSIDLCCIDNDADCFKY